MTNWRGYTVQCSTRLPGPRAAVSTRLACRPGGAVRGPGYVLTRAESPIATLSRRLLPATVRALPTERLAG